MTRRGARKGDDEGMALVLVVGSMLILFMLSMTALAYTLSSQKFARFDQDYSASVTAAQSGVEDFISRLNRLDTYGTVVDCTNPAWKGPMNPATNSCTWNTTTTPGWAPVEPGETDPDAAWFHYSVDNVVAGTEGRLVVTSTGRVNGVSRTVEVGVGKNGTTDYVYYTDYESADPSNEQTYPSGSAAECGGTAHPDPKHWWEGRNGKGCTEIQFITGDTLDGAVFTNDAIFSTGARFLQGVESAKPNCASVTDVESTWNGCLRTNSSPVSTADFNHVKPLYAAPKSLADTSAAFVNHPGCHYFGSTRVIFNAGGTTMTVWNKRSINGSAAGSVTGVGAPIAIAPPGGTAPSCGPLDALDSDAGATVPVPTQMVIYVAASGVPMRQCFGDELGGPTANQRLPLGTFSAAKAAGPTGIGQFYTVDTNMLETTKYCGAGNLYVEGTLKGRTTVAAAQSVIITGDLVLAGGTGAASLDMLGIVATNSVDVFHPRVGTVTSYKESSTGTWKWGNPSGVGEHSEPVSWPYRYVDPTTGSKYPADGIQIAGSIQTLQHSFLVQKYDVGGDAGLLFVKGSIAQKWRGIVGEKNPSMNGYLKLYSYDQRLKFASPPYFPKWADSQWTLRYSGELATPLVVKNSSP